MAGSRFSYSAWDGTQRGFDLDAFDLLERLTDDLLYHGDPNSALRRMLQEGFRDRNGERLEGMREMLEKLRERRREELEKRDLGGVYDDIADQLEEILEQEKAGIEQRVSDARDSGDQRRKEITEDMAQARQMELELMPPDLAGRVQAMQEYGFMDDAARQRFEEQMDELSRNLQQAFPDMPWNQRQNFSGDDPMGFGQMSSVLETLGDLDQLE